MEDFDTASWREKPKRTVILQKKYGNHCYGLEEMELYGPCLGNKDTRLKKKINRTKPVHWQKK